MSEELPVIWFQSLERLTEELNLQLSRGKVIGFNNFYNGLIRDSKGSLVYLLGCEWTRCIPRGSIAGVFAYGEPFFSVEENCPEHKQGRIGWAKEKPFGMSFSNNSLAFEYGLPEVIITEISGEFPNLKYHDIKEICWGEK
jgi:hypothetical protein